MRVQARQALFMELVQKERGFDLHRRTPGFEERNCFALVAPSRNDDLAYNNGGYNYSKNNSDIGSPKQWNLCHSEQRRPISRTKTGGKVNFLKGFNGIDRDDVSLYFLFLLREK